MNKKTKHIIAWGVTAVLCLAQPLSGLSVFAVENTKAQENDIDLSDAIHISDAGDLENLVKSCAMDSWSRDKIVVLDRDIDLNNVLFTPIPTFGGIFLGQDHTISGLNLEGGSDYIGLFRYLQKDAQIHELHLTGSAVSDNSQSGLSLLVGNNSGLISNCTVSGCVTGGDYVGTLAGKNSVNGVISDCHTDGYLYGNHMVGSIAGSNEGSILNCYNNCEINTTVSDNNINISSLTISDLFSTENAASVTDIGGIAGSNSGIIRACVNYGSVGYQHVGYNIGGIAGSQTGYIEGCINYGILNGRKDVGGIAGQMEPSSEIEYLEDTLDKLNTEFNKLHSLVTKMTEDAGITSSHLTDQIARLLTSVENTQKILDQIADQTSADMNDIANRLTDTSSLPTPNPISLDFLDPTPSPTASASTGIPSADPSVTPSDVFTATPADVPTETPSDAPAETPSNFPGEIPAFSPDPNATPFGTPAADASTEPSASPLASLDPGAIFSALPTFDPDDTFDREAAEKELNKIQDNIYNDASEVVENAQKSIGHAADLLGNRVSAYHVSLSASFSAILSDMQLLNSMADGENQILLDDFQAITDELNVIENIITTSDTPDPDEIIDDISDEDGENDITGKIMNCYNKGKIYGDLNVGGIAGAMSRENNLDPEDDLSSLQIDSGTNIRYKERMVIRKSQNLGVIEGKKKCIGGIAGNMALGSIIDCIGSGDVSGEGDMIGGIAGQSKGSIRGSSAKCALSGENQIGGIAGYGENILNCYSMIEIKEGNHFLGSIAGKAQLNEDISQNYFVEGCPAGIDGISYEGIAEPVSYADFMILKDLPDVYHDISLTFMADDRIVSTVTLSYGESFDVNKLPAVPKKEGYFGRWEDFDSSSLTFDQTVNAVYSEYITTLESEETDEGFPLALIEGTFETGDRFTLTDMDAYPENARTKAVCRKISIYGITGPYTVRCLIPDDMEHPQVEIYENEAWKPVSGEVDGSYYVFHTDQSEFIFCLVDRPDSPAIKIAVVSSAALLVILIIIMRLHKKRKKSRDCRE